MTTYGPQPNPPGSVGPTRPRGHWTDSPTKVLSLIGALLGVVTGLFTLLSQLGAFGDFRLPFLPGLPLDGATSVSIGLSVGRGPSGTEVTVTGHGFAVNEVVEIRFHTEQIGTAQVDGAGTFSQNVRVPGSFDVFAPQQFDIVATGNSSARSARAPFQLVVTGSTESRGTDVRPGPAKISLSRGSGPSGIHITVSGENFQPGEEVEIYFHADQIGIATVDSSGRFSQNVKIPGTYDAFAPQQFQITATGNTSIKSASRPFRLTPH
jgi:hypothetical protein